MLWTSGIFFLSAFVRRVPPGVMCVSVGLCYFSVRLGGSEHSNEKSLRILPWGVKCLQVGLQVDGIVPGVTFVTECVK